MKVVAIIQARMGSSRLPRKILMDIAGKPMLCRVLERVEVVDSIDEIVVATTNEKDDDKLTEFLLENTCCKVFRGSTHDVLSRFYKCAKLYEADIIVRVTADDPLKDPGIISEAINFLYNDADLDYCSNTIKPSYPEGLDIEVIRFSALEKAYYEARLPSEREHVTPFIWKNSDIFKTMNFEYEIDLSEWRWTVDKEEDMEFMQHVFEEFKNKPLVSYLEVIDFLQKNSHVMDINSGITRNEGYLKSIQMENNETR